MTIYPLNSASVLLTSGLVSRRRFVGFEQQGQYLIFRYEMSTVFLRIMKFLLWILFFLAPSRNLIRKVKNEIFYRLENCIVRSTKSHRKSNVYFDILAI